MKNIQILNKHIYIISNEEIKQGDWIIDLDIKKLVKADDLKVLVSKKSKCWYYKKIIITTDQDLIKDGVQAIDDEFLQWFSKNPSCENVTIIPRLFGHPYIIWIEGLSFKQEPKLVNNCRKCGLDLVIRPEAGSVPVCTDFDCRGIIISNETLREWALQKQRKLIDWVSNNQHCKQIESCYGSLSKKCICPKEPTEIDDWLDEYGDPEIYKKVERKLELMEAAEKLAMDKLKSKWEHLYIFGYPQKPFPTNYENDLNNVKVGFIEGAKWQQERMYSEEEVAEIFKQAQLCSVKSDGVYFQYETFEQFKKK